MDLISDFKVPTADVLRSYPLLAPLAQYFPNEPLEASVDILIGANCPLALEPLSVASDPLCPLIAIQLRHGWTVIGSNDLSAPPALCFRVQVQEQPLDIADTTDPISQEETAFSREDEQFLQIVKQGISFEGTRYSIPLPFKDKICEEKEVSMPNNYSQASRRLMWQRQKMLKDESLRKDYTAFIEKLIDKGYCEPAPDASSVAEGGLWYLPHHGVYNINKPGKIRVVFDCSARFNGICLNDILLQGPDFMNNLFAVFTRFREQPIAFVADLEAMFYQVRVPPKDRSFLRLLWFREGDLNREIVEYQMCVHIFGAISSPSIANFVVREIGSRSIHPQVTATLHDNFYMDDCLKSSDEATSASNLIKYMREDFSNAGFRLTKFICNNRETLDTICTEDRALALQIEVATLEQLPVTRVLGVIWNVDSDTFGFKIKIRPHSLSRRGILSVTSSLFDPLGMVGPVAIMGKKILQEVCRIGNLGWDDPLPEAIIAEWKRWLESLQALDALQIPRCLHFELSTSGRELHIFSDASATAYGAVVYLRYCLDDGAVSVLFLLGKARLAPLRHVSIPRLELTAAVMSTKLYVAVTKAFKEELPVTFYTDSMVTLNYIRSESGRFPIYVANRVQHIRDRSSVSMWRYVPSSLNPADIVSRGITPVKLLTSPWIKGPSFLQDSVIDLSSLAEPSADIIECGAVEVCSVKSEQADPINMLVSYFSRWSDLKRSVAWLLRLRSVLQAKARGLVLPSFPSTLSLEDLGSAEIAILRWLHGSCFRDDLRSLSKSGSVSNSSALRRLDPFLLDGLIRVGGRIRRAPDTKFDSLHPILLPRGHHVTSLLIMHEHVRLKHAGRLHVLASLRDCFWPVHGQSSVRSVLYGCVVCRRYKRPLEGQKMADLPISRIDNDYPFKHTGVDLFGPFLVRNRRTTCKRYGVIFTCLASRAVHLELAASLETDSFLNAFRRFAARRGPIEDLYCDNGTNFHGAERELREALQEHDKAIHKALLEEKVTWHFNPPAASHMGGCWERLIRSVRAVLNPILNEFGSRLDDEALSTLFCEAEATVNSRPLTGISDDPSDLQPLTPAHLLLGRPCGLRPPPGDYVNDTYSRKRWRRVQHYAQLFWSRWKKEFMRVNQSRSKWTQKQPNVKVGDVVIFERDAPRGQWPLALVTEAKPGPDGLVRTVTLKGGTGVELRRPVTKCVLLIPSTSHPAQIL